MSKTKNILLLTALLTLLLASGFYIYVNAQQKKRLGEMVLFKESVFTVKHYYSQNGHYPVNLQEAINYLYGENFSGPLSQYVSHSSLHKSDNNLDNYLEMEGSYGNYKWYPSQDKTEFISNKKSKTNQPR